MAQAPPLKLIFHGKTGAYQGGRKIIDSPLTGGIGPWSDTASLLRHAMPVVPPMSALSVREPDGAHATG
jgi:hypothetical protein